MRKIALPLTVIGAVLVLLFATGGVGADSTTWTVGFQVQNLGTATANITITYYNQDGSVAATQVDTIAPGTSKTYYGATMNVPDGFNGSVVVTSDQPVVAIANQLTADPTMAGSYIGVTAGATEVNLPLVMRENNLWNTAISVQNAGTADANVTLNFYSGATVVDTITDTIPPGASHRYDQSTQTNLGAPFVGSAVVTSDQPVAAEVNETDGAILMSYTGFPAGATTIYAPLIMTDNNGWYTGLQVQNIGASTANVELKVDGTVVWTGTIAPDASETFYPVPGTSAGFVGSATVECTNGQPLVGIVNELHSPSGQGMSYTCFVGGTDSVFAPLIMTDNSGWYTGLQVQNIGASAANVELKVDGTLVWTGTIGSGLSETFYPVPGTSAGFVGSAAVECTNGQPLVGIVNEITLPPKAGENSMAYECFNQ